MRNREQPEKISVLNHFSFPFWNWSIFVFSLHSWPKTTIGKATIDWWRIRFLLDFISMANSTRRRLSFVDFAHPQVWHKLIDYAEMTIAFTKLSSLIFLLLSQRSIFWIFSIYFSHRFYKSMDKDLSFSFVSITSFSFRFSKKNRNRNSRTVCFSIFDFVLPFQCLDVIWVEWCTIYGNRCF